MKWGAQESVSDPYQLRAATVDDAPVLARQRRAMFESMDMVRPGSPESEALERAARTYFEHAIPDGAYYAWLVEHEGAPVAGGGVQVRTLVPRPGHLREEPEALVLGMWTDVEHRRHGLARRLMEAILAWCETRDITRIALHASEMGRPLYERLGFTPTNEMRLERKRAAGAL